MKVQSFNVGEGPHLSITTRFVVANKCPILFVCNRFSCWVFLIMGNPDKDQISGFQMSRWRVYTVNKDGGKR